MRFIRFLFDPPGCYGWAVLFLLPLIFSCPALAQTPVSLLLTSNLQGRFSLDFKDQDNNDPLLLLAQNIIAETENGADVFLDLGNAFYPGVLSKYSMGSVMMDFLDYFSCAAVLVSSKDLQVGTNNLEFLQTDKRVRLLSANIAQKKGPLFTPWFDIEKQGVRIAILGISSPKIEFDIAEKEFFGYRLIEDREALKTPLREIEAAGIEHVVLLSGLNLKDTTELMEDNPRISLALCGGDYTGSFFSARASRLDLDDGRSVIIANDAADYYRLDLVIDDTINIASFKAQKARPVPTDDFFYASFTNRLTLWKQKFIDDESKLIANLNAAGSSVNDERFSQLLRDRFDCEIAIVEERTINPSSVGQGLKSSDFLAMVNQDAFVFRFSLTGDELKKIAKKRETLVITGLGPEFNRVQGYALEKNRPYRVAATQPAMHAIMNILRKPLEFTNTWTTVTDLLKEDLKKDCVVLKNDYDYLDRRFRITLDTYFANFINNCGVKKGDDIETPAGQSSTTYNKWGLEDKIDLTIYNKYHRFVFTPYMLYSRKDDDYLNNILKGTALYEYNLYDALRPYNKFRCDTVVEETDGLRPVVLRETLGVSFLNDHSTIKAGLGFEKEVQEPAKAGIYGIELLAEVSIPFLDHFTYKFDLDSFSGIQNEEGSSWQIRSEINNRITVKINTFMKLSLRHKFVYVYEGAIDEYYQNSHFLVSLDLNKDWKFW